MIKKTVHTSTRYVVNGREYGSLEEMPEADRKLFVDENRNGIPDGIEQLMTKLGADSSSVATTASRSDRVIVASSVLGDDPTARILEAGSHEAPPLPGEVRPEPVANISVTLHPKQLLWIALLLGIAVLLLWRLL